MNIYLPTAGKESQFLEDLGLMQATVEELLETYPNSLLFIRGDANASVLCRTNNKRDHIFNNFCSSNNLQPLDINHLTYHHFTGGGLSDSGIDVLLQCSVSSNGSPATILEDILDIVCNSNLSVLF